MEINIADVVLCELYFSDLKTSKKRPVLVLKDNLPYDNFVGIPISSQLEQLYHDEHEIDNSAFSHGGVPKKSKLILRKPFVISKTAIVKIYGTLNETSFKKYYRLFCEYFHCI
ncbi:MAG: type II toxin-antitoxin system PemK/MazF family toxin [Methylococcaceae bacterium]|jgi:mRNA interferase MazF